VELRVDVDGVDGDALHLLLVEGVGRELEGVARVGEIAVIVHGADWHVQQTWGGNSET